MKNTNTEKYLCPCCDLPVEDTQKVVLIYAGYADNVRREEGTQFGRVIDERGESLIFHDECYIGIAGRKFYPPPLEEE